MTSVAWAARAAAAAPKPAPEGSNSGASSGISWRHRRAAGPRPGPREEESMKPNPYEAIPAVIMDTIDETPLLRTRRLKPERPLPFRTGQFIELSLPGVGEAPFTPSSSHFVTDIMDVTVMKAGFLTEYIHRAKPGDRVGLRGPYGSAYPRPEFEGKDLLLLGGGCGLAPLRPLFLPL